MSRKITACLNAQSIVEGGCTQLPSGRNLKNWRLNTCVRLRLGRTSKLYLALCWLFRIFAPSNPPRLSGHQKKKPLSRKALDVPRNLDGTFRHYLFSPGRVRDEHGLLLLSGQGRVSVRLRASPPICGFAHSSGIVLA